MLKMKERCQTCGAATGLTDVAYICSFECTFCRPCTERTGYVCPNCQGDLVVRPTRVKSPARALFGQIRRRLFGAAGQT